MQSKLARDLQRGWTVEKLRAHCVDLETSRRVWGTHYADGWRDGRIRKKKGIYE